MNDPVFIARTAWGSEIPDWVLRLAEECAASSQAKVATKLARSQALVSNVLRKKYPGDMASVEDLVRGTYLRATVLCPALREISTADCRHHQQAARTYTNENSERVRMYRACRCCARFTKGAPA